MPAHGYNTAIDSRKPSYGYNGFDEHGYVSPPPEDENAARYTMNNGGYDTYNDSNGLSGPPGGAGSNGASPRPRSHNRDAVGQHLLYETAMMDSHAYTVLDIGEIDALKKEQVRLNSRIEGAQRKLALESKIKDAAQNMQRLYQNKNKSRPDTPQSPDSNKQRSRSSLLGNRTSSERGSGVPEGAGGTLLQADGELAQSMRKVDELNETVKGLLERRQQVERTLLRHTAAVLADQVNANATAAASGLSNGDHSGALERSSSQPLDGFDDIRDLLQGASHGSQKHEQQMKNVQEKLEHLNAQLESVLAEGSRTLGKPGRKSRGRDPDSKESLLENLFANLEDSAQELQEQQHDVKDHYGRIQNNDVEVRNAVEHQMEELNNQLHNALLIASEDNPLPDLEQPPQATGHGYQHQMQYLEDSLLTMEQLLQQHGHALQSARDAGGETSRSIEEERERAVEHEKKAKEYDTVMRGLWEILQSDSDSRRPSFNAQDADSDSPSTPNTPLKESFSIAAFSTRMQHTFDRAQSAKEQQDILRRQVQQQRDLNGKSDAEKDRQLATLQTQHEELVEEHRTVQDELAVAIAKHTEASGDASKAQAELEEVMNEYDSLKEAIESRQQERDNMARQLKEQRGHTDTLQQQIDDLEAELAEQPDPTDTATASERDALARELKESQSRTSALQDQVDTLQASLTDATDDAKLATAEADAKSQESAQKFENLNTQLTTAETRASTLQSETTNLEAEVVRLTTELTMAKAELDGAYGSRAERKGAQAAEVDALAERNRDIADQLASVKTEHTALLAEADTLRRAAKNSGHAAQLERELQEMTSEFQGLTRESIEMEKERDQLDGLLDGLRERCEELEAQIADQKVMALGAKSPGGGQRGSVGEGVASGGTTSTMVLRQEFRRMMRDTRAEGIKALRAEQEERRRVESELRKLRGASMAGRKSSHGLASPSTPSMPT